MIQTRLCDGLVIQRGDDGHWLEVDGKALISVEGTFDGPGITDTIVRGWARRMIEEHIDPRNSIAADEIDLTPIGLADPVNHPPHYTQHPSGIECIQITEHMGFNLGNAVKYIWRADLKDAAIQDLEKATFYLKREIALRGGDSD